MTDRSTHGAGKCPVTGVNTTMGARSNQDWWPNQLNVRVLHQNPALEGNPMGGSFDYAKELRRRGKVK